MAMYVPKGTARWGAQFTATAIKVAKDKVQSAMEVTGKRFFLPSSFRSSVERSKAHSRASGRRSPKSMNFPSLILATNGPGMPKSPKMGSTRVGISLAVGSGGATPAATVCVATAPSCCGAVEARVLAPTPRGWTSESLAKTELEQESPAWGEPAPEATNHVGTTGRTPDNVPADRPAPTKTEGCGGQAHVPQPLHHGRGKLRPPTGSTARPPGTRPVVHSIPIRGRGRGKTKATINNNKGKQADK